MREDIGSRMKVRKDQALDALQALQRRLRELEQELTAEKARQASTQLDGLLRKVTELDGVRILAAEVRDVPDLRDFMDKAKAKLKSGVIVFGQKKGNKVQLIAGVTKDLSGRFHAGKIVRRLAEMCGGKGGGRPEMAMAGGTRPEGLAAALASVPEVLESEAAE